MIVEVLVVDDDHQLRWVIGRMLTNAGMAVESVRTAREAVYAMELRPAKVVLMDLGLAADDAYDNGCEAAIEIARRWPKTRVLMFTGWGSYHIPESCHDLPMIPKPFSGDELVNRIHHLMSQPPWKPL